MNFGTKRMAVAAAATLVVAGGAAAAVAATGSGSHGTDFLDSVAKHLGVSPQKLQDATKAAAIDQVNADLAAGRITKAQADALKTRIEAGNGVLGGPASAAASGRAAPAGPVAPAVRASAPSPSSATSSPPRPSTWASTRATCAPSSRPASRWPTSPRRRARTSPASSRRSSTPPRRNLDKAVAAKKLTQSQADDILAKLKSHIDDVANATLRFRGPGGPGGRGSRSRPAVRQGRSAPRRSTWG